MSDNPKSSDVLDTMFRDTCVYWAPSGNVDNNGQVIFSEPVEISCRWVESNEFYLDTKTGTEQISRAKVRLPESVTLLGVLWHGSLDDIATGSDEDPFLNRGAWEIRSTKFIPDFENQKTLYIAWLNR